MRYDNLSMICSFEINMYKLFNRVAFNFSKSYDVAVIGGGPGGKPLDIQDTWLPSRPHNWD